MMGLSPKNGALFDRIWSEGARRIPRMRFTEALEAFANTARAETTAVQAEALDALRREVERQKDIVTGAAMYATAQAERILALESILCRLSDGEWSGGFLVPLLKDTRALLHPQQKDGRDDC